MQSDERTPGMHSVGTLAMLALATYTIVLLCVEFTTSQSFVRNYFTDIDGPVPFYAINTTLSVSLLWGTALLCIVALVCLDGSENVARFRRFCLSQALVFGFLGLDDRFKFHEWAGWHLDIPDHFILMVMAVAEVVCVGWLGGATLLRSRAGGYLVTGTLLAGLMLGIDALAPEYGLLRLSLEDLSKTWAAFFYFLFGWQIFADALAHIRGQRSLAAGWGSTGNPILNPVSGPAPMRTSP